jgi:superfamily II DNA helicase RecQ
VPPYAVFPDRTLEELVRTAPSSPAELARVRGLGSARLERYGVDLLQAIRAAFAEAEPDPSFAIRPRERRPEPEDELYHALARWRRARAAEDDVPPYVVLGNRTLEAIVERAPRTLAELGEVPGIGPTKLELYGEEVLAALTEAALA